jgi:3-oxoacyl-[acyl-carrier-protein] synthase-3
MDAYLCGLQYALPEAIRSNEDLVASNPTWDAQKIFAKTGIRTRRIAADTETAGDLVFLAADKLLNETGTDRSSIDALLFCTQSPDHLLPATACLLQERLGLARSCATFDFNLGCSGFTYGLWLARALIKSGSARNVLFLAGDTLTKYCAPDDMGTIAIFGDAGSAALISTSSDRALAHIGPSVIGTDGRGGEHLMIRAGCSRMPRIGVVRPKSEDIGDEFLRMNGPEVFGFTMANVQPGIQQLLNQVGLDWDEVDFFLLHQANAFMLENLRKQMKIPKEKLPIDIEDIGNTSCASIPILMRRMLDRDPSVFRPGHRCVMVGFGVGFSWAITDLTWLGGPTL